MKKLREYKIYDIINLLKSNNYKLMRQHGSHQIWLNDKGNHVSVPVLKLNRALASRLVKEIQSH